ncbi:DoxX-like family protein [Sediminibacillus albus]|uniref:DoxX-like family protein n=1 Tax=Sediminibacillus albus TaxID=407036 RepID=A0A1G9BEL0_9BACI|nr:DoxX-like family protein [Sediminibacillus albus]SDK37939.1 DoxX-like family protein [Sediminibacillus albus]
MKSKPIYVEIPIQAPVEKVWEMSQDPQLHEQWDLRFSSITYLPRESEDDPQSFLYENKFGIVSVAGWGKSIGTHNKKDGSKTSSLHFGTAQKISPIREGRGYWKYIPTNDGTTFLTQYDYGVRFGLFGKLFDLLFRPIMGWATALSFDVLKQWIETGESAKSQYLRFFNSTLITILFFFVWLYQGLVPKIIAKHPEEVSMLSKLSFMDGESAVTGAGVIGVLEVFFGLLWLLYREKRHLHALQIVVFPVLTISSLIAMPSISFHPINLITFNASLWVLTIIGFTITKDLPKAARCKRTIKVDSK